MIWQSTKDKIAAKQKSPKDPQTTNTAAKELIKSTSSSLKFPVTSELAYFFYRFSCDPDVSWEWEINQAAILNILTLCKKLNELQAPRRFSLLVDFYRFLFITSNPLEITFYKKMLENIFNQINGCNFLDYKGNFFERLAMTISAHFSAIKVGDLAREYVEVEITIRSYCDILAKKACFDFYTSLLGNQCISLEERQLIRQQVYEFWQKIHHNISRNTDLQSSIAIKSLLKSLEVFLNELKSFTVREKELPKTPITSNVADVVSHATSNASSLAIVASTHSEEDEELISAAKRTKSSPLILTGTRPIAAVPFFRRCQSVGNFARNANIEDSTLKHGKRNISQI